MPTILIASRNDHKAEEIGAILGDGFAILSLDAFPDAPPVIENGDSFAANAFLKRLLSVALLKAMSDRLHASMLRARQNPTTTRIVVRFWLA